MTTFTEQTQAGLVTYNVNPTGNDQAIYQVKGLDADAKDPSDYLRLVARTFSSFRDRVSSNNVSAYLNGFEVDYSTGKLDILNSDNVLEATQYHIFKINSGACFLNNQFIEFTEKTMFYKTKDEFTYPVKNTDYKDYAIVITYGFIDQYNDSTAKIQIVPYNDLTFTIAGDDYVCAYKDSSLLQPDITYGVPALLIAKFSIMGKDGIVCTTYETTSNGVTGREYNRINYQGLDKLYMLNYKKLFEYFGNQAQSVFSSAGLTQATFINVGSTYIDQTVKTGDMVRIYQDPLTNKISYKPALASRQKFDQVVGLYLYDVTSDNHTIFINGLVTIDSTRYKLPINHPLNNNLVPGLHYYMENSVSIYDTTPTTNGGVTLNPLAPVINVGDLALMDNSGRITTRYYNGSVMIGTATACNQILININHSMEIGVQGLLELFGDNDTFNRELLAQKQYHDSIKEIATNTKNITNYKSKILTYNDYIGTEVTNTLFVLPNGTSIFPQTDAWTKTCDKVREMYIYLAKLFNNSKGGFDTLKNVKIFETTSFTTVFNVAVGGEIDIVKKVLTGNTSSIYYSGSLYKLKKILMELQNQIIDANVLISNNSASAYNAADFTDFWAKKQLYFNLSKNNDPVIDDDWERPELKSNARTTYTVSLQNTNTEIVNIERKIDTQNTNIKTGINLKQEFDMYNDNVTAFLDIVGSWIDMYNSMITTYTTNYKLLENSNIKQAEIRDAAELKIVRLDPLALDIFHMDEYQRKVFNYTYVSDRLKRCLYYVDIIQTEYDKVYMDYAWIYNNHDASSGITPLDKILVSKKLESITNKRAKNQQLIIDYKIEFNALRIEFGLEPFKEVDFVYDLDPGDYIDERLGQYRFGLDDHTNCINGLCENWLDECKGIIYDEFAIVANQSDINLGKIIEIDNLSKNTTIDLFRITDNNAIDSVTGKMIIPMFTLTDDTGLEVPASKMSISTTELAPSNYIVGKYPGYQIKLNIAPTMTTSEKVYTLKIDTTKHVNTLKLNIKVV